MHSLHPLSSIYVPFDFAPAEQELRPGAQPRSLRNNTVQPSPGNNPTQPLDPQYGLANEEGPSQQSLALTGNGSGSAANFTSGTSSIDFEVIDWTASEPGSTCAFRLSRTEGIETEEAFNFFVSGSATNTVAQPRLRAAFPASSP